MFIIFSVEVICYVAINSDYFARFGMKVRGISINFHWFSLCAPKHHAPFST